MLQLQPVRTDSPSYDFVENLLTYSFPPEEYREPDCQCHFTDHIPHFHNQVVLDDDRPVGLLSYWDFGRFYYVEHFAIHPDCRNGGYGAKVLQLLFSTLQAPIVLEVEVPTGEIEQRRIRFYERQGFALWKTPYRQPPYRSGGDYLPMHLMVHGNLSPTIDFDQIRDTLYREVYRVSS